MDQSLKDRWLPADVERLISQLSTPKGASGRSLPDWGGFPTIDQHVDLRGIPMPNTFRLKHLSGLDLSGAQWAEANRIFPAENCGDMINVRAVDCRFDRGRFNAIYDYFERCSFARATFAGGRLRGQFIDCDFSRANLSHTHGGATYVRCNFAGASFKGAHWKGSTFKDCTFTGARFGFGSFVGSKFIRTSLDDVDLKDTLMDKVTFE
ncbi:MAG: pentapeptide repeat-containing protein [Proteobacteria bacterium]|nr:pentapeptide repeat-containing protein [Pseudomonadota bacterium]